MAQRTLPPNWERVFHSFISLKGHRKLPSSWQELDFKSVITPDMMGFAFSLAAGERQREASCITWFPMMKTL